MIMALVAFMTGVIFVIVVIAMVVTVAMSSTHQRDVGMMGKDEELSSTRLTSDSMVVPLVPLGKTGSIAGSGGVVVVVVIVTFVVVYAENLRNHV